MKIVCIIQARMGSSRLPGKVMKNLRGKTVLGQVISRVLESKRIDKVIVATTINSLDDTIVKECRDLGVNYYRGSEENVLSRYYNAAKKENADIVVRITSDCPLIDPKIIDKMIVYFESRVPSIDYLSNSIIETFPRGFDVEIFSFEVLEQSYKNADLDYEKEHVTPYIYMNKDKFKIKNYSSDEDYSKYRLTLDTIEDYLVISKIYNDLYKENEIFYYDEIIEYLNKNPSIVEINKNIKQKRLGE